jgi:four helix bundle protein
LLREKTSMPIIEDYTELRCYKLAFQSAMEIFHLSKAWPREENYSLTSQIRRSSRAVASAIGEAWGKRRYPQHFVSKLTDSDSECCETRTWLEFAKACGYLSESDFERLYLGHKTISGSLVKMMSQPNQWCGPARLRSETTSRDKKST